MPLSCRARRRSAWQRLAIGGVTTNGVRSIAKRERPIQMFVDGDVQIRHRRSNRRGFDLEKQVAPAHGVVLMDDPFMLDGKHAIQILTLQRYKSRSGLSGRPSESSIELLNIGLLEKTVRPFQRGDPPHA